MLSPGVLLMRLTAARALALRRGVWFRVRPPARALIDAVVLHFEKEERRQNSNISTSEAVEMLFLYSSNSSICGSLDKT